MISLPINHSEAMDLRGISDSDPSAFDEESTLSEPLSSELSDPDCDLLKEVPELDSEEDEASSDDVEREESVEEDDEDEESELEEDDDDEDKVLLLASFSSPLVPMKSESSTERLSVGAPCRCIQ